MGMKWSMESCLCDSKFWGSTPAIIITFNTCILDLSGALHFTQYKALLSLVTNIYATNKDFQSWISGTQVSSTHHQRNLANLNVCAASVVLCIAISSSWRCIDCSSSNWVIELFSNNMSWILVEADTRKLDAKIWDVDKWAGECRHFSCLISSIAQELTVLRAITAHDVNSSSNISYHLDVWVKSPCISMPWKVS